MFDIFKINLANSISNINLTKNSNHFFSKSFFIIIFIIIFPFISIKSNKEKIKQLNNKINCNYVEKKLKNRTQPLEYEKEFFFFIDLISCDIPFSLIRFADGENSIMKGEELSSIDKWHWNPNNKIFQESLIQSTNICNKENNFIGIPCKNWIHISNSILSFSNCTSSKYMTYSTVFTNNNFKIFKSWITHYITSYNRRKIILVANSVINKNINWAYKFIPIPTHLVENWDDYSFKLLSELSKLTKLNDYLIFFVSAGPASNIIISYLIKINNKNIYIDFGSSIEFITKGYSTRSYSKKSFLSTKKCETFIIKNKSVIYS